MLWDVRRARSFLMALDLDYISKTSAAARDKPDLSKKAHCGPASGAAFCDDGLHLITYGGQEAKLRRWDLTSGRNTKTAFQKLNKPSKKSHPACCKLSLTPSFGRSSGIAFVPEGSNVAVVDVNVGKVVDRLRGHYGGVQCTVYNERQHDLLTGGGDHNVLVWDANRTQYEAFEEDEDS
jgi:WD40 repeat protein